MQLCTNQIRSQGGFSQFRDGVLVARCYGLGNEAPRYTASWHRKLKGAFVRLRGDGRRERRCDSVKNSAIL
jgi:hypothetical protein